MKVQKVRLPNSNKITWFVLDSKYLPVEPIKTYLNYLDNLERSPNTVHAYANHLKLYWEYLEFSDLDWTKVTLENLADFITWLRRPDPKVISMQVQKSKRTESTINFIITVVCCFYDFHERVGIVDDIEAYAYQFQPNRKYKSFLHHINKGKETRVKLLKLKEPRRLTETLTKEQVKEIVEACSHLRDKLLIHVLYETGMRIGQLLGLRHEDIRSWDNEIQIVPRDDNFNGARAKTKETYTIHVSKELMSLYAEYLTTEYPEEIDSDYLFVNIWEGRRGHPLTYSTIQDLFIRLNKKTGITFNPHLFRHTHATDLIRQGWDMAHVQKRLGHTSIQTTINTYTHLNNDDMKEAFQDYLEERDKNAAKSRAKAITKCCPES